ncbi:MAG: DUF3368 domain-containing protein [Salinibacter sp.]|uniref:DUF3368 domain-containing protein n=1 Tax=Salinibacter sp. TaxID=2065818 RepID=UPI0035D3F8A5
MPSSRIDQTRGSASGKEKRGDLQVLDPGEREATRLSVQEKQVFLCLIDERAGRTVARTHGRKVTGTVSILGAVAQKGLIDPVRAVRNLRQTSFRVSADLYH